MSKEKVAIVTGANKGLGFEIVKLLCQKYGGIVYLTSRDKARGIEARKKLQDIGLKPEFHQLDITNQQSIESFMKYIKETHEEIDILINNAGILFRKDAKENKIHQAEKTISVNFSSLVDFCETILPIVGNGGKIVNISSSSGHLSRIPSKELRKKLSDANLSVQDLKVLMQNYLDAVNSSEEIDTWGDSAYVVSKVGVNAYTFILHRRLASRDVKVNCVHPGYIRTDMTNGAGNVPPSKGASVAISVALSDLSGEYIWHDGTPVPWHGQDPRIYIDGRTA